MSNLPNLQDLIGGSNTWNDLSIDIQEEIEVKANCSPESYSEDSFDEDKSSNSEDLFDEDEIKELEESRKLLNDLSKDLKTKAIENIDFNSYFGEIDEEYVKSRFVEYIKDFINNYHTESNDKFNIYVDNDIIFRMGLVLRYFEAKNNNGQFPKSNINYIEMYNLNNSNYYDFIICKDNIQIEITELSVNRRLLDNLHFEINNLSSYIRYRNICHKQIPYFNYKEYLENYKECNIDFDCSICNLLRITDQSNNKFIIVISSNIPWESIISNIKKEYETNKFKDLLASEINSLLLTISGCKLPTFSKFSLKGLNFQKFKDEIELKKQELNHSIEDIEKHSEELNLKNKSIEELISMNLKRNEELEEQIKNKEIKIYNLNKQIDDLEQTYKSFKRFEDFQGFFEDTSISEYQKLKQVEHDYQEYQKRSDEMKAYDEIIQNFELYRNDFLVKSRDYSKLMEKHFQDKKQKLKIKEEELEKEYQKTKEKLISLKEKLELIYKQKSEKLDKTLHKAINDANDKQKYWQNIIDHAEEHITSKLQKQLQEQINQFSKFNSAKWDSQVSFNIISSILKSINHKGDLIRLGIKTDELEFKNLNEVLKCIQIFNMFGLCTNDKNENILMNKFTFNFIDKINSYMKQFNVLDPDYKK